MKTNDLKKIIDLFAPINDAISIIEKVATLEQAENEAKQRIDQLRKECNELNARNLQAQTIADGLIAEATARANSLAEAADKAIDDAKISTTVFTSKAKLEADNIVAKATAKAEILAKQAADYDIKVEAAKSELADLEGKIAKAQAQIAKLLGGN